MNKKLVSCSVALVLVGVGVMARRGPAQNAATADVNWSTIGGSAENTHYSKLTQINRDNVAQLKVAWTYETGEAGGLETTPLEVDGVLYALTPKQEVIALDGATGAVIWKFDSGIKGTQPNRGPSWWTDGKERRLLVGVMNFIYCLDPATGKPIASFGKAGRVDLREDLGRDPAVQSVALTSPGVIYKDLLIVGGRNPESDPAPPGDIRAYNVRTGALAWSFHTIPHPGEVGYETWPPEAWKTAGSANNWAGMAVDPERGIVFVPTGSAVSDFYGANRVGDDLFADTLLALDANTGKRIWHFQGVHHDMWDRDFPSPPILMNVTSHGKTVPAVGQTTKQGFFYMFNRTNGEPLFPIEQRSALPSDTPGEVAAKTQPYPLLPAPFAPQYVSEVNLTTRTPEAHAWAEKRIQEIRHQGQFVPLSVGKDTLVSPSFEGGAEWGGPAVDPDTQVLYVNANTYASLGALAASSGGSPGRKIYVAQCASCHGQYRQGAPPEFPGLLGITKRLTPAQLVSTIHTGKGRMPAMPVEGQSLKDLLAYLGTEKDPMAATAVAANEQTAAHDAQAAGAGDPNSPGAALYKANCSACHQASREGVPPVFPSLIGIGARYNTAQLYSLVHGGRGKMPAFPAVSEADSAAIGRYLGVLPAAPETPQTQYTMTGYRRFNDPDGYPATAAPWGTLNALDLKTGKYLWQIPFGQYPELTAKGIADTGTENYGGPVVTAGGLIFIAATNFDHKIRAFDKANGKLLWEAKLPFAGNATPAVYQIHGREYVVIAAGGSSMNPRGPIGGVYVAFALPK